MKGETLTAPITELNPVTASGEYLDRWATIVGATARQSVRFQGLKFIWYFMFPIKGNMFELAPPRGTAGKQTQNSAKAS
jgi:hypothetical protein